MYICHGLTGNISIDEEAWRKNFAATDGTARLDPTTGLNWTITSGKGCQLASERTAARVLYQTSV